MGRYIDAEKVKHRLFGVAVSDDTYGMAISQGIDMALKIVNDTPTADVYEEVHGHWINTDSFDNHKTPIYQCAVCINEVADNYIHLHKYCLHCGAKMDGGNLS